MEDALLAGADQLGVTTLQIVVPADPKVLRVLRLVASGVASLGELDLDAVEEVRVAVDELGSALIAAAAQGASVTVSFELDDEHLRLEGSTEMVAATELEVDPLTDRILDAVTTSHTWEAVEGRARCRIEKRLTSH